MGRRWLVKDTQPTPLELNLIHHLHIAALLGHVLTVLRRLSSAEDTKLSLTSSLEFNDTYDLDLVTFDIQFGTWIGPDAGGKYYLAGRGGDAWIGPDNIKWFRILFRSN